MKEILIVLISYFIGNFSSSYILCKLTKKEDLRKFGSGNAGATNALRVYGARMGLATLLLDLLKGFLASILGRKLGGETGQLLAAISVVAGHNWPVFLGFKGGKGIATSIGVLFSLSSKLALISLIIGFLIIYVSGYVSLASIIVSILVPFLSILLIKPFNKRIFISLIILAGIAVYRHRSNIDRLRKGTESKIRTKRSE